MTICNGPKRIIAASSGLELLPDGSSNIIIFHFLPSRTLSNFELLFLQPTSRKRVDVNLLTHFLNSFSSYHHFFKYTNKLLQPNALSRYLKIFQNKKTKWKSERMEDLLTVFSTTSTWYTVLKNSPPSNWIKASTQTIESCPFKTIISFLVFIFRLKAVPPAANKE